MENYDYTAKLWQKSIHAKLCDGICSVVNRCSGGRQKWKEYNKWEAVKRDESSK